MRRGKVWSRPHENVSLPFHLIAIEIETLGHISTIEPDPWPIADSAKEYLCVSYACV